MRLRALLLMAEAELKDIHHYEPAAKNPCPLFDWHVHGLPSLSAWQLSIAPTTYYCESQEMLSELTDLPPSLPAHPAHLPARACKPQSPDAMVEARGFSLRALMHGIFTHTNAVNKSYDAIIAWRQSCLSCHVTEVCMYASV